MQILFGAHETVIRINSNSMSVEYIQHFISTHFINRIVEDKTIIIPASKANFYHRTFLLKWLYSLYAKKHKPLPELKESLLKRYHKGIKIVLKKKIIHTLSYKVVDNKTIHLKITPQNSAIALTIKTFLQATITVCPAYLKIILLSKKEKLRLEKFFASNDIIDVPHKHIYDKNRMKEFLTYKQEKHVKKLTPTENAHLILGVTHKDDLVSIKKQYKNLAKKFHPDKVYKENTELIDTYTKKFQEINKAYKILTQ